MRFWVVAGDELRDVCYILDEGYNVFRFTCAEAYLINAFIPVIGLEEKEISSALIKYVSGYCRSYVNLGKYKGYRPWKGYIEEITAKGYLVQNNMKIYTPGVVLRTGLNALVSEFGELLRLDIEWNTKVRLEDVATSVVGEIHGADFGLVFTKRVKIINKHFADKALGDVTFYIESEGDWQWYSQLLKDLDVAFKHLPINVIKEN